LKALILGVDGQDGSFLTELLLEKGYQVFGWIPSSIPVKFDNIQHLLPLISLSQGNFSDQASLEATLEQVQPDEIYNLASPSSPAASWDSTVYVGDIAGLGVARLLEAIRTVAPRAKFYQASTSELFGNPPESPQNEETPFRPRNPYGISKLYAHWLTVRYREQFGLFTVSGILYNHESPRRGLEFVTRKITHTAAQIKLGMARGIRLGNLEARRDWGYAINYVKAMWQMLQQEHPEDYVIGTGVTHSVREFCQLAFAHLDLDYRDYIYQDPDLFRPEENHELVADYSKAAEKLNWHPEISFDQLVRIMVDADLMLLLEKQK